MIAFLKSLFRPQDERKVDSGKALDSIREEEAKMDAAMSNLNDEVKALARHRIDMNKLLDETLRVVSEEKR